MSRRETSLAGFEVRHSERGGALVVALLAMLLLTALGIALTMNSSIERQVAANYRDGVEALYAADAAIALAATELRAIPDWSAVLDGTVASTFTDGPIGVRSLGGASTLDLGRETALLQCGQTVCTAAAIDAYTVERPWGPNNPRWQPYGYGRLADLSPASIDSRLYVVVWMADDPSENDGRPRVDGDETAGPNPGRGVLCIQAHAFGPSGVRRAVEATVARTGADVRILSWREVR